jgi:hypothetical protein
MSRLLLVASLFLAAAASAQAQPPAPPPEANSPEKVCLTNNCDPNARMMKAVVRDEAVIAAAIEARDLTALVRAGGSATEAVRVAEAACVEAGRADCRPGMPGTEKWLVAPSGVVIASVQVEPRPTMGPDGRMVTPAGTTRNTQIQGVAPRPDMPPPWNLAAPGGAQPIYAQVAQPDGRAANIVTGWRQPDGGVTQRPTDD